MEEEKEVHTCLEELDGVEEKPVGHVVFEELKKNSSVEKAKVELKTLLEHLKYVFLGENAEATEAKARPRRNRS